MRALLVRGIPIAGSVALLAALTVAQPPAAAAQRPHLITVHPKKGPAVTLRDASFGVRTHRDRSSGSRPPGMPVGPTPGNAPGPEGGVGGPGEGGGSVPSEIDPRQPTHNLTGGHRNALSFLGSSISEYDAARLRRIDIVRVENGFTYGDFVFKDGSIRGSLPMNWDALSGWERPGREGKFHYFDAEDILFLEFPEY